jgi:hypothetical protein
VSPPAGPRLPIFQPPTRLDASVTRELGAYRNLAARWTDWAEVKAMCRQIAATMLEQEV